ncbi:hypothetical protein BV898_11100 [Hypsibius exemplaris]|uniref:SRCR domain-containing protein n=1 Tax=Hypsibius exemplaris TaxID=2072580 RepID=A0A1W0WHP8_HYPEX|nr:hypothetical protein BV898_11100 [Hypsibius exemplaris]
MYFIILILGLLAGLTQSQNNTDVRLVSPVITDAGNVKSGQVEVFSAPQNGWIIGCSTNRTILQSANFPRTALFPKLMCNELGFRNATRIRFGELGFGTGSAVNAMEYVNCPPGANSLKQCVTAVSTNSCKQRGYIHITCNGLMPSPLPTAATGPSDMIPCDINGRNIQVDRYSAVTAQFTRLSIPRQCSTTLTVSPGDFLTINASHPGNSVTPSDVLPPPAILPDACPGTRVEVTQVVIPGRKFADRYEIRQTICGTTDNLPVPLFISSAAVSVNFTYIRSVAVDDDAILPEFQVRLQAKPQLSVDCKLPRVSVSLAKLGLANEISGDWLAEVGEYAQTEAVPLSCQFRNSNASEAPAINFFDFQFSSAGECRTVVTPQEARVKVTNVILITRTRREPDSLIERLEQFRLPIECIMQADQAGANTGVDGVDGLTTNVHVIEPINSPYRIILYRDAAYAAPLPLTGVAVSLLQARDFYVEVRGSVPRPWNATLRDQLTRCSLNKTDSSPIEVFSWNSNSFIASEDLVGQDMFVKKFRFTVQPNVIPMSPGKYQLTCSMSYTLSPLAARKTIPLAVRLDKVEDLHLAYNLTVI